MRHAKMCREVPIKIYLGKFATEKKYFGKKISFPFLLSFLFHDDSAKVPILIQIAQNERSNFLLRQDFFLWWRWLWRHSKVFYAWHEKYSDDSEDKCDKNDGSKSTRKWDKNHSLVGLSRRERRHGGRWKKNAKWRVLTKKCDGDGRVVLLYLSHNAFTFESVFFNFFKKVNLTPEFNFF